MLYVIYTIHIIICLFLVVLLQQGKGADLSVFGGGSTQTAFGARGAATLLHKLTVVGFIGFILTTMTIGFLQTGATAGSVMSDAPTAGEEAVFEEALAETEGPLAQDATETGVAETAAAAEAEAVEEAAPAAEGEAGDPSAPPASDPGDGSQPE